METQFPIDSWIFAADPYPLPDPNQEELGEPAGRETDQCILRAITSIALYRFNAPSQCNGQTVMVVMCATTSTMMRLFLAGSLLLCLALGSSCHKSGGPAGALFGSYVEYTPVAGGSTLNFITGSTLIASGTHFFLEPLSAPDTLNYFVSSDRTGPLISFIIPNGAFGDTVSLRYQVSGLGILTLSFNPCPQGAYCGAYAGTVLVYIK